MATIIDGKSLFQNKDSERIELEKLISGYENFLTLYEKITGYDEYYITFHPGLEEGDNFIDGYCPHCEYALNEITLYNKTVYVHSKIDAGTDLDDVTNWGILEIVCPHCNKKTVAILE